MSSEVRKLGEEGNVVGSEVNGSDRHPVSLRVVVWGKQRATMHNAGGVLAFHRILAW